MHFNQLISWADDSALRILLSAVTAIVLALVLHAIGAALVRRVTRSLPLASRIAHACHAPTRFVLPLIALQAVWQIAPREFPLIDEVRHANVLLLLACLTWLGLRVVHGTVQGLIASYPLEAEDNLHARRIHTQAKVLANTLVIGILVTGLAAMLMTFPEARQFGASLLASAGVVGIIVGMAARPVLGNLVAGLQIALGQPLRIDDVLIVQGEWGRVEEITGTYVVLRVWDQRRLIIPLQWFIENPFQNWSRRNPELIGTVFLWVDYGMPIPALRTELDRICAASAAWDRRYCKLDVTDTAANGIQLRVEVTAANADLLWRVRCDVREGLVDFMQRQYPQHLPRTRAELHQPAEATGSKNH
ncbi:MAG: mechanosensitive ion channel domain-containing protein [Rhodoferax sp.]|uniref:mechanosensitive ion channel family protein n=1 Tax=Rhodoferax sp. TaxID=50421 RepID=UPI003264F646